MMNFLKDHGETAAAIGVGLITLGGLFQRDRSKEVRLAALEKSAENHMTQEDCLHCQGACKAIQCLKHAQYKEDTIKLTRLIEHVSEKSDDHYEKMIARLDTNMGKISELMRNK